MNDSSQFSRAEPSIREVGQCAADPEVVDKRDDAALEVLQLTARELADYRRRVRPGLAGQERGMETGRPPGSSPVTGGRSSCCK